MQAQFPFSFCTLLISENYQCSDYCGHVLRFNADDRDFYVPSLLDDYDVPFINLLINYIKSFFILSNSLGALHLLSCGFFTMLNSLEVLLFAFTHYPISNREKLEWV